MAWSATDFLGQFLQLLPRGAVWPRDPSSVMVSSLSSLMPTWARLAARDANLLIDAFPATTVELLPEWEATLGLPDPCLGPDPSLGQRQAQVVAKFASLASASIPYLTQYAATLGYTVTVEEFAATRCGALCGVRAYSEQWVYVWGVICPDNTITPARVNQTVCGDRLAVFATATQLQCVFDELAHAHTMPLFLYTEV